MRLKSQRVPLGVTVVEDIAPRLKQLTAEEKDEEDLPKLKELKIRLKSEVSTYYSQICAVWMMQIAFSGFILFDSVQSCDEELLIKLDSIPDVKIGFTRFISGMIMHIMTNEEMKNGMRMMKYAANHWWKFKYHRIAFLSGLFQFTALFVIALCNYLVITISTTTIDIAKDFTALLIIADFDEIFGKRASRLILDLISDEDYEELFKIETTTSKDARMFGGLKENRFLMYKDPVYDKMKKSRQEKNK